MLVCVVGNFGNHEVLADGQCIKTVELYNSLVRTYGEKEVGRVNLCSPNKVVLAIKLFFSMFRYKNFIVLVSKNGRKTVIPLMVTFNKLFHKHIFHSLIGSTTHQTLDENIKFVRCFNALSGNWSETNTEKRLLEERGLSNVSVIKNFKDLNILPKDALAYVEAAPFPICTFSRVEALKGIPNIVSAVEKVNARYGKTVLTLDIYGKIMESYKTEFDELKKTFSSAVRYKGIVDFDKSVDTLKQYYMVAFPTRYYTEGIPGTILDAFAAGVPVLCSEWESCYDIMTDEVGVIYPFNDDDALEKALEYAIENPAIINEMKISCIEEARKYTPDEVIKTIGGYLKR